MKDDILTDITETDLEQEEKFSPRRGRIVLIMIIAVVIMACYFAYSNRKYTTFSVQQRIERSNVENTDFLSFNNNLFSYSRDGASLSDFDGNPIWNESFDMENPICDKNGEYIMVYDRERTNAVVMDTTGTKGRLSMTLPIIRASISANGNVAVLMQDGTTAYLRLMSTGGKILASGEIHAENSGYPIAMDLSPNATKLMVSMLDLGDGDIKTTLFFYDFSEKSKTDENHILADFSYADEVIPEVAFLGENAAVAFADEELMFFDFHKDVSVRKRLFQSDEIKSVFYSDNRAAIITTHEMEKGGVENALHVFNEAGVDRFVVRIPSRMTYAGFMDNGEILLHNGHSIRIFKDDGRRKLTAKSEEAIRAIIPWDGQRNYYFITKNQTQKVLLE